MYKRQAGIAGIKYLDGASRHRGDGNYNYVIFDDQAVKVMETYYQSVGFIKQATDAINKIINIVKSDNSKHGLGIMGGVQSWLADLTRDNLGIDISAYNHGVDTSSIKHIINQHGDTAGEASRGQIAVTENDLLMIPEIIAAPDYIVYGTKNRQGLDGIIYVKNHSNGSTYYVEEVRGKKSKLLVTNTMRIIPGTSDENRIRNSPTLHVLSDAGTTVNIISNPAGKDNMFSQMSRGSIDIPSMFGNETPIQITITPQANASTAIHEMSHYFLWEMEKLAQLVPGDFELQADLATTKKWLGWKDGQAEWTREQQETWARGFEAYMREGKAPSVELKTAFARFKGWLCEIYHTLKELDVELSDDVRSVFDRLLATEEDKELSMMVKDKESEGGLIENLVGADAAEERKRAAEESKTGILAKILQGHEKLQEEKKSREYQETLSEVRDEVSSMPVYRAMAAMAGREGMKLSVDRLLADYGTKALEGLPEDIYGTDGTKSADEIAQAFNYGSGDEMLSVIREAPAMDDEIQARMEARFGAAPDPVRQVAEMGEEAAYSKESLKPLLIERGTLDTAQELTDEEWADFQAQDEAYRAAIADPRSRPNVIAWIRKNGGLSYQSVKDIFGEEQAAELLKRCGIFFFKKPGLGIDVAAESMTSEGAYFGQSGINADQELFNVLMGEDPAPSPYELAKREGFAEARRFAKERADKKRLTVTEREKEKAYEQALKDAQKEADAKVRAEKEAEIKQAREWDRIARQQLRQSLEEENSYQKAENKKNRQALRERADLTADAVQSAARDTISRLPYTKVEGKISLYKAAERKARGEYYAALKAKEWKKAEYALDRAVLNHALVSEAKVALKVQREAFSRIDDQRNRNRKSSGGMQQEWVDQTDLLMSKLGLIEKTPRMQTTQNIEAFCQSQERAQTPCPVARWIRNGTEKEWLRLTAGELSDVNDALKWFVWQGRESNRLSKEFELRNLGEVAIKTAGTIRGNLNKLIARNEEKFEQNKRLDESDSEKRARILSKLMSSHLKVEFICRILDGGERVGQVWDVLFRPLSEAEDRENVLTREYTGRFKTLLDSYYDKKAKGAMSKKKYYKLVDLNLSKEEIICLALNYGNKTNIERILSGYGWDDRKLRYLFQSALTSKDWDFVQATWDMLDTMWPQVAALQRDIIGYIPERVEAQHFTVGTADGGTRGKDMRGGYYPIAYNRHSKSNRFIRMMTEKEAMENIFEGQYSFAMTKHGHTEARARSTGFALRLDLGVVTEHMGNVIHDLAYRKAIIDVNKILRYWYKDEEGKLHRPVEEAIIDSLGENVYNQFQPWLQRLARSEVRPVNDMEIVLRWMIRRTQVVTLGLKAAVSLSQTLGWTPAAREVGGLALTKNILSFYHNPLEVMDKAREIFAKSESMKARTESRDRDLRSVIQDLHAKGKYGSLQESYFYFINLFDAGVVLPIWLTAYEKAIKENNWSDAKAVAYADSVVRTTQDIGTPKDLSAIQTGGPFSKLFTMFYNAMNTEFNMVASDMILMKAGKVSKGQMMGTMLYVVALPALLGALMSGNGPEPDDDGEDKSFFEEIGRYAWWGTKETLKYPFNFVPLLRDVASGVFGDYGYRVSPAFSGVEQLVKTTVRTRKAIEKWNDGETEDIITRPIMMDMLMMSGYAFGLPTGQAKITLNALFDWLEGEKEVKPQDFFLYRKR